MKNFIYDEKFFNDQKDGSFSSARKIVPLIIKIVDPNNVIDIGCGVGTWLRVFEENNVKDVIGIDGEYVNSDKIMISKDKFLAHDLSRPLDIINRKFDLAISLEVAEHIKKKYAKIFIKNLIKLSDVIVF